MRLKLLRAAPCFFDSGLTRYAGTLRFPQTVRVEAFLENVCRIRGDARQGGVAAWIPYSELEPLPENLLTNLQEAEERRQTVEGLIAQNEVAIGMTEEEVSRSVGKPQKKTKRAEKEFVRQVWEYIRYELVPQTTVGPSFRQTVVNIPGTTNSPGRTIITSGNSLASSIVYVRVPVGKLSITFLDGIVESLDQSEGTLSGGQVSVVIPPLEVVW
ncbi:MAG: hypothetical protein WEB60_02690 [Terrimicrobiaceae bacterium]